MVFLSGGMSMRRSLLAGLAALALCLSTVPGSLASPARAAGGTAITIMHFNDDYELTPTGSLGGMAFLAGQIGQVRQQDPQSLLLFAGDLLSPSVESSVFKSNEMIAALNRLNMTAATFGNHEFDHGDAYLANRIAISNFPWVSSNVIVTASGMPFPGAVATKIVSVRGIKVGMLGLLTQDTSVISSPGHDLTIAPIIPAARAAVASLQARGATLIVAITHQDMPADVQLATAVPRIDLIVGGHDHMLWQATVGHTLITKSESDAHYLGVTTVNMGASGHVASMLEQDYLIDPVNGTPDPAMNSLVTGYEKRLTTQLSVVVGHTSVALDAREISVRQKESPLGDYIADAMRAYAKTDVALMNGGGIRTNAILPAGPISRKSIIAFLPFGNALVSTQITGSMLKAALENGVSQVEKGAGRFPQVSGIAFTWNRHLSIGSRIRSVTVNGQPLVPTQIYTVATNDYMLQGGDGYTMLGSGKVLITTTGGPLLATVVIDAVQHAGTIAPATDGRITEVRQ